MYDRGLTSLRSPYDKTEAYIVGENKKWSVLYSSNQRRKIIDIATILKIPRSIIRESGIQCDCRYSAQGWINQYEHLVNLGEMEFMKEYL